MRNPFSSAAALAPLAAALAFVACTAPAEPPNTPPGPPNTPPGPAATLSPAEPVATAAPEPVATATPEPVATAAPESESPAAAIARGDLVLSPGDPRLEPAAASLQAGKHLAARIALTKVTPDLDKTATLDVKMAAHALLARACQSLADALCAAAESEKVRASWRDPAAAVKELDALPGDENAKRARLVRALKSMGEALFYVAEGKRLATEKEKVPVYKGSGTAADVHKHVVDKVGPWIKARRALNEEAEKAYLAVVNIQPVPPPQWVVASAARVGDMWGKFVAELRAAPIPEAWKKATPEAEKIRKDYYSALDEASEPFVLRVRAAYETCQSQAKKLAVQDEYSKRCGAWVARNPKSTSP